MKTKIVAALLIGVLTAAVEVKAQDESPHSLREDAWALQFGFTTQTLTSLLGSTMSAKHHFSANRAMRYGVDLRVNYEDRDDIGEISQISVGLQAQYLVYPMLGRDSAGEIHLFYGAGPEIGYASRDFPDLSSQDDQREFLIGVGGVLGAEWFVKQRISVSAEYRSYLRYRHGNDVKGVSLSPGGGRLGLSVYF